MSVNSFPKDRDYRREVMQATAASGFAGGSMWFFYSKIFLLCEHYLLPSYFSLPN